MKQSFTDAHREVTARMERENFRRDQDGRVILSMTVRDDSSFLSVYSEGETPVISSEVAEFLEKSTDALRPDEELSLCIASDCIGEEEKKLYPAAVREKPVLRPSTDLRIRRSGSAMPKPTPPPLTAMPRA